MVPAWLSKTRSLFHKNMRQPCQFDIYLVNVVGIERIGKKMKEKEKNLYSNEVHLLLYCVHTYS